MTIIISNKSGDRSSPANTPIYTGANITRGAERHPEKRHREDQHSGRKPSWIRVRAPSGEGYAKTIKIVREQKLFTVCEEAGCPNIGECWEKKHATFMILGSICSRACAFCNVATGKPQPVDDDEPHRVANAVKAMDLRHCVITSVDRDDLTDGGAAHFVSVIKAIRAASSATTIEILTPDFKDKPSQAVISVIDASPDVFNHNLETVPRLYPTIRPGARYFTSLQLLAGVKQRNRDMFTKSGLMVGLGESIAEISQVMDDLRAADVDFITIGQYLQPTMKHARVERYWTPQDFEHLTMLAKGKGFLMVSASPLTRSSHHAGEDFAILQKNRKQLREAKAKAIPNTELSSGDTSHEKSLA